MNKREVSEALGCSTRQVEKYVAAGRLAVVEYIKGKSGREGVYDPEQVERLRGELEAERREVIGHAPPPTAITAQRPQAQQAAAMVALLESIDARLAPLERLQLGAGALADDGAREVVTLSEKLTLSLAEASQLSGLSYKHLRASIRAGELKARIIGRGWRVKRADLDAYIKGL